MDFLVHLRKDFTNFNQAQFAQAVQAMHGFSQYPINAETIADLEDPNSPTKYPVSTLREIALYCTRVASVVNSRLIEYQDIVGFQARAVPDAHYVPPVAQDVAQEPEDTSPALAAVTISG